MSDDDGESGFDGANDDFDIGGASGFGGSGDDFDGHGWMDVCTALAPYSGSF